MSVSAATLTRIGPAPATMGAGGASAPDKASGLGGIFAALLGLPGEDATAGQGATVAALNTFKTANATTAAAKIPTTIVNETVTQARAAQGADWTVTDLLAAALNAELNLDEMPPALEGAVAPLEKLTNLLDKIDGRLQAGELTDTQISELEALAAALDSILETVQTSKQARPLTNGQAGAISERLQSIAAHLSEKAAQLPALANGNTEAAAALQKTAAALTERVQAIAEKLVLTSAPGVTAEAGAADPEIANTLTALFGSKDVDMRKSATLALEHAGKADANLGKPQTLTPQAPAEPARTEAGQTLSADDGNGARLELRANQTPPAGAPGLAAAAHTTGTGATDTQSDPLLFVQSAGQPAASAGMVARGSAIYQPVQQLNIPHIAVEIARQAQAGTSRFQIRLDPPEMGKIDVEMDIDGGGTLHARLTVERSETLDLLQRDARTLERALAQAGLEGGKTNLEFSLKQQNNFLPGGGFADGRDENARGSHFAETADGGGDEVHIPPEVLYRGFATPGGVNIWV